MSHPRTHPSRRFLLGTAALVATLGLAACSAPPPVGESSGGRGGGGGVELPKCPLDALKEAKGKVKVKLWYGGIVQPPVGVLTGLIKEFNASQDKIEITGDNQGVSYDRVLTQYENTAAKPKLLPQIIYLEDTTLGEMVDKGQVLPAESCMRADNYDKRQISAVARSAYSVDDVMYPGYVNVSTPVLYYNKVHFQKAGLDPNKPPTTIAEIAEYARKIKAAGVAPQPLSFKTDQWFFSTWLAGAGQDAVNNENGRAAAPTKANLASPTAIELMKALDAIKREGLMAAFPKTDKGIDHYLALVTQQSSMLIETSTASGTIAQALGGELDAGDAGEAGVDIGSIDLSKLDLVPGAGELPGLKAPGKVYASGGAFYILNQGSDAQQAASWEFLKFMLRPENAKRWHVQGGYLPVVKAVVTDPAVIKFHKDTLQGRLLAPAVDQLAVADPDYTSPLIGPYSQYTKALQGAMEKVFLENGDPEQALKTANAQVDKVLKDYNGG